MKYAAPTTVSGVQALLADNPGARVFAGATDLIPQMRAGRPEPSVMIDLKRIDRLMSVNHVDGCWIVGAAVPTSELTRNAGFTAAHPAVSEGAGLIGSDQIQNRCSLGGNLCNASPAADSVPALIASQAAAVIATAEGERTVAVSEVVTGPGETSLADDEFVIEFRIDDPPPHTGDAYLRMIPRSEMDIAVVGAAVRLTAEGDSVSEARVVLGAVAPTAVRVPDAEAALVGSAIAPKIGDDVIAAVAAAASAACAPINDKRGTIQYRTRVAGVLAKRATLTAAERARNGA